MIHAEVPITDVARAAPKPNGPLTSPSRMLNAITNTATSTGNPPVFDFEDVDDEHRRTRHALRSAPRVRDMRC